MTTESISQMAHQPSWIESILREAGTRRGLILYGNIRDLFYDAVSRQYVTLPEFITRLLMREKTLGFTLTGTWDRADGLRFPDDRNRERFEELLRSPSARSSSEGSSYDAGEEEDSQNTVLYPDPNELIPAIRRVLARDTERPLFLMNWSHLLVSQAANPDPTERQWILHLGKALIGDAVSPMDSEHLRSSSGLVILIAANLGSIPPILYQGDPRLALIPIPVPSRSERADFFFRHLDDLRCRQPSAKVEGPPENNREKLADTLADLTEQLTTIDLRQILSLALRTPTPLAPEKLLNLYRLGDQRSPWEDLMEEKVLHVEDILKKRVVGQDEAVRHVGSMIIRAYMGLAGLTHSARQSKPKGTLFFVGPPGVGKTELAKALAEVLFGDESACIRFDMSEYNHEHSDQRLLGAPPGYVGFEAGGQLTNAVRERPFCVLLFDEIEKAHPRILDKFFQILEDGRLTDGRGETVHFSECVIIFTSNIGNSNRPDLPDFQSMRQYFIQAVQDHFVNKLGRPELRDRFGNNIVVFDQINSRDFQRTILQRKIAPLIKDLQERFGVSLHLSESLEAHFLQQIASEKNGRGVVNVLDDRLVNPLARFLLDHRHQLRRGRILQADLEADNIIFNLMEN